MLHASPKFLEKLEAKSKSSSTLPPDHRAFLDAAWTGDSAKISELLAKGVPVDVREDFCTHYLQNEQTALMYAAAGGHLEIVRTLLHAGASVSAVDKNMSREDEGERTALHYAVRQKNVAVLEELLGAGADINALTSRRQAALHLALWHGSGDAVRLLVKRGASLGAKIGRKQVYSPLFAAVDAARNDVPPEVVRELFALLLEAGADPNDVGDANMTAIFPLISTEKLPEEIAAQMLEKLLEAGAKPDCLSKLDSTPLESAVSRQKPKAVKLLLEAGADVNRVSNGGTAWDMNLKDTARCEKDLRELAASPPPSSERAAELRKKLTGVLEEKLRRCREIGEILRGFGAKGKADLS